MTSQFDEVYLGIPYESHKGIKYPDISYKGVKIVRLEKDIGSCSKLLGGFIKRKKINYYSWLPRMCLPGQYF